MRPIAYNYVSSESICLRICLNDVFPLLITLCPDRGFICRNLSDVVILLFTFEKTDCVIVLFRFRKICSFSETGHWCQLFLLFRYRLNLRSLFGDRFTLLLSLLFSLIYSIELLFGLTVNCL